MIEFVDLTTAPQLDRFVLQHEHCHFMQTSLWGRVKNDWHWYGIIYRGADRSIKGTMALLSRRLKGLNATILYAPRGPIYQHSDWNTLHKLLEAAKQLAYQIRAIYLRLDPMVSENDTEFIAVMKNSGFLCNQATDFSLFQPRMCYVMGLKKAELLEEEYHRTTRQHLRFARKQGVHVVKCRDVEAFYALMQKTAQKNCFALREFEYFKRFLTCLGENAQLYLAKQEEQYIAASIAVFYGNRAWFMYGASDPEMRSGHPNELLQWTMQTDAIERGCKYFDLRGVEGYPTQENPKYGLHQFKRGFAAEFVAYAVEFDYVCRPFLYHALKLYNKLK